MIPCSVSKRSGGKEKENDEVEFCLVLFGLWFAFELRKIVV